MLQNINRYEIQHKLIRSLITPLDNKWKIVILIKNKTLIDFGDLFDVSYKTLICFLPSVYRHVGHYKTRTLGYIWQIWEYIYIWSGRDSTFEYRNTAAEESHTLDELSRVLTQANGETTSQEEQITALRNTHFRFGLIKKTVNDIVWGDFPHFISETDILYTRLYRSRQQTVEYCSKWNIYI